MHTLQCIIAHFEASGGGCYHVYDLPREIRNINMHCQPAVAATPYPCVFPLPLHPRLGFAYLVLIYGVPDFTRLKIGKVKKLVFKHFVSPIEYLFLPSFDHVLVDPMSSRVIIRTHIICDYAYFYANLL
jgi:hypothetical protein